MLYGTITDNCTQETCQVMSAGPKFEYLWNDGTSVKKPIKCSAPKYIDLFNDVGSRPVRRRIIIPLKDWCAIPKEFR